MNRMKKLTQSAMRAGRRRFAMTKGWALRRRHFEDYLHHYMPVLPGFVGAWLARSVMTSQLNAVDAVVSRA